MRKTQKCSDIFLTGSYIGLFGAQLQIEYATLDPVNYQQICP